VLEGTAACAAATAVEAGMNCTGGEMKVVLMTPRVAVVAVELWKV
jgi:hypothetical protein